MRKLNFSFNFHIIMLRSKDIFYVGGRGVRYDYAPEDHPATQPPTTSRSIMAVSKGIRRKAVECVSGNCLEGLVGVFRVPGGYIMRSG